MGRSERRAEDRSKQKLRREVNMLTPNQTILMNELLQAKIDELLDIYKDVVDKAVYEALRNNHISKDRTDRIMLEANKIIKHKLLEEK